MIISKSGTGLDLMHILFGSILTIDKNDVFTLLLTNTISIFILAIIIRPLVISIINNSIIKLYTSHELIINIVFFAILIVNIVINLQVLGTLLIIGLMIIPASCAKLLTHNFNLSLLLGIVISFISSILGIYTSYVYDTPVGPTIILVLGLAYISSICYVLITNIVKKPHYIN